MKRFGVFLLVLGLLLGLGAGGWMVYNEQEDERAGQASDEALAQLIPIISGRSAGITADGTAEAGDAAGDATGTDDMLVLDDAPEAVPDPTMDVVVIDGYTYIGYLSIPEIDLDLPVQATWSMDLLEKSPARYSGSLAESNLIILGHNYRRHFTPLKRVSVGARVVFTDVNGVIYNYVVAEITTVGGHDEETMRSGSDNWDLTLFTCTYGGKNRLTLRCVLEGEKS